MPAKTPRAEFDKNYRKKHWVLRISFTANERDRLKKIFGNDLHRIVKSVIRLEMLKRELMGPAEEEKSFAKGCGGVDR
jgi:hypothetical protein